MAILSSQSVPSILEMSSSLPTDDISSLLQAINLQEAMNSPAIVMDLDDYMCATYAKDIYKHLVEAETKNRPSEDCMEHIQRSVDAARRVVLVDWLIEIGEYYMLAPDTLHRAIHYLDRYLSGNMVRLQKLQLLAIACLLIATKYEERGLLSVRDCCNIACDVYSKEEILDTESAVLKYLKYDLGAPTAVSFLGRFVRAVVYDHGEDGFAAMKLGFLASFIAEISLLDYGMIRYAPSMVAASAVYLANFYFLIKKNMYGCKGPWSATMAYYTSYEEADLRDCVFALHALVEMCETRTDLYIARNLMYVM